MDFSRLGLGNLKGGNGPKGFEHIRNWVWKLGLRESL